MTEQRSLAFLRQENDGELRRRIHEVTGTCCFLEGEELDAEAAKHKLTRATVADEVK